MVTQPMAVRYCWDRNPIPTLFNAEGLPASPFYHSIYGTNFINFAEFMNQWLMTECSEDNHWCDTADFNRSTTVAFDDLYTITIHGLEPPENLGL